MALTTRSKRCRVTPPEKSWVDLPVEIRSAILKAVVDDHSPELACGRKALSLAPYTATCLEWQSFFEQVTFRGLTLDNTAVEAFDRIVRGEKNKTRLNYIRHLWLRIRIPTYTCSFCRRPEDSLIVYRYVYTYCFSYGFILIKMDI